MSIFQQRLSAITDTMNSLDIQIRDWSDYANRSRGHNHRPEYPSQRRVRKRMQTLKTETGGHLVEVISDKHF
jgi:hypothetical protein